MQKNNFSSFLSRLQQQKNAITKLIKQDVPRIIKVEGLNHFEESWDNQGFTDSTLKKWDARREPAKKFRKDGKALKSYKKWAAKNKGRAILVSHRTDTRGGHLKDSIKAEIKGNSVIFSTDKPYAKVHNEGGKAGRGKGFIMPKRQFLGASKTLNDKIMDRINTEISKIFS